MENFLNSIGIDLPPEEIKPHDIEETARPNRQEKKDTEEFLNEINNTFDEVIAESTNNTYDVLQKNLDRAVTNEDYEEAAKIRDKTKKLL